MLQCKGKAVRRKYHRIRPNGCSENLINYCFQYSSWLSPLFSVLILVVFYVVGQIVCVPVFCMNRPCVFYTAVHATIYNFTNISYALLKLRFIYQRSESLNDTE